MQVIWDSPHQSLLDTGKLLLKPEGEWIHPRTQVSFQRETFQWQRGWFSRESLAGSSRIQIGITP